VRLGLITFEERQETNDHFKLFLDVRKYGWGGIFKMQNEKWKDIIRPKRNLGGIVEKKRQM